MSTFTHAIACTEVHAIIIIIFCGLINCAPYIHFTHEEIEQNISYLSHEEVEKLVSVCSVLSFGLCNLFQFAAAWLSVMEAQSELTPEL